MQRDRAHMLARQHAETARLLGVDFVPAYRVGADGGSPDEPRPGDPPPAGPSPTDPSSVDPGSGRPERPDGPAAAIEIKPRPDAAPARSRDDAQQALDALRERYIAEAPHQDFVTAHSNIVFGEGDPRARLMFVGEAPGAEEDRTGRPFVGRAGQLLDKMIVAMGLRREDVYICNVLKTRPPNNATPTVEEARLCAPYLYEQIRIVSPEVIVTLGLPASRLLLETDRPMRELRGRWAEWPPQADDPMSSIFGGLGGGATVPVMPTYHPAFLLRSYTPENRKKVWSDLQKAMERLGLATSRS